MTNANEVIRGEELQSVIRDAANLVMSTAGITVGPEGRPVIMSKSFGAPEITKDGYKVVNSLKPKDVKVAKIVELLNQTTSQANEKAGDGTTTATLLVGEMLRKASKHIAAGRARMKLRLGIERGRDKVIEEIKKLAKTISSQDEIAQIGTISANGDNVVGKKIAEAMEKVGKEGVITVEEGKGLDEFSVSVVKGMVFDRGYLSPYFVTNSEKMTIEFDNPYILLLNKKISSIQSLVSLLEAVLKANRPLLIIAEDVEGEALTACVLNKLRGGLKIAAVKAPGFGDRRADMLEDIRILTGAKNVLSDDLGINLEDIATTDLGSAKTITITKDETTIVDGGGDQSQINARINNIKNSIKETSSEYDKEKLQERLAKLAGGVAVLKVGGSTDVEMKERKDRVEDALHATRAAVEEGIVAGGGATLLYITKALDSLKSDDDDEAAGINIVRDALKAPITQIIENCGEEPSVVINKILEKGDSKWLFDAKKHEYADAFKAGIIDPAKVVRVAIESAASVASVLATTEVLVVELPSEEDNASAGGGAPGMGGMGGMGGF
ncbi:MAG: chaperonin GroEL [Rickettsiaceae bacterium H1]|nr:chaperonin GroEL [Rickettsiaceae bacterium H1]